MNIFVIGTGRCGTTTFFKASKHIKNYTVSQESNTSGKLGNDFEYPKNHIEIDPRLSYFIPLLKRKYVDCFFVHLQRDKNECLKSLEKRSSLIKFGTFHLGPFETTNKNIKTIAEIYYDNTNFLIEDSLINIPSMHIWLHDIKEDYLIFLEKISAICDKNTCLHQLKIKHNKSEN